MRRLTICFLLPAVMMTSAADAALPASHPGPTVNDYTAAQSSAAEAAARGAGYSQLEITMVQAGDFFLTGEKDGQKYFLTVTPDGKVYPSGPTPAANANG